MSKMSELHQEITEMLEEGHSPKIICRVLGCPLSVVYDVNESREDPDAENFSPFLTVNS